MSDDDDPSRNERQKYTARVRDDDGGYQIRNVLKVPRATTYTAQALYDQIRRSEITLDTSYQRDVVWPDTKMIGLIDSVLRNLYVPPVIFAVVAHEDGSERRVCVDGKQRLTSLMRFMDGLIPYRDPMTSDTFYFTDANNTDAFPRKILPEKYRRLFANKQIVCVEYHDLTERDEMEVFQATNTPRAAFIRSLTSHFLAPSTTASESTSTSTSSSTTATTAGILSSLSLDWVHTRAASFRCLAQITLCLHAQFGSGPIVTTVSRRPWPLPSPSPFPFLSLLGLERFLASPEPFTHEFEVRVWAVLRIVGELAADSGLLGLAKGGASQPTMVRDVFTHPTATSPVEFVMICAFVGAHMEGVGIGETMNSESGNEMKGDDRVRACARRTLAQGIWEMRVRVREEHGDMGTNNAVAIQKMMGEFIRAWRPEGVTGGGDCEEAPGGGG
ncbi:hypothetical protein DXG03_002048 [Asterophora parasitica]|uniref:GmrSD restriction endonucleases N-terminal domain-containing protein n=1 Tax=Asterophora parasitica TaxID=117018 RepID=A0A9P7G2G6_9AGAR|nr:hypothetical protein DXG03_002048 [Asterophora parasitica]